MLRKHLQILGIVSAMLCMGCAKAIPPGAVAMTCTAATLRTSEGAPMGRYTCDTVKAPNGKEAPVRLADTSVGHQVYCTETAGKITCPNVPLARYAPTTPWFVPSPSTFPPVEIANPWWK